MRLGTSVLGSVIMLASSAYAGNAFATTLKTVVSMVTDQKGAIVNAATYTAPNAVASDESRVVVNNPIVTPVTIPVTVPVAPTTPSTPVLSNIPVTTAPSTVTAANVSASSLGTLTNIPVSEPATTTAASVIAQSPSVLASISTGTSKTSASATTYASLNVNGDGSITMVTLSPGGTPQTPENAIITYATNEKVAAEGAANKGNDLLMQLGLQ